MKGPCVAALFSCSHRLNFWGESSLLTSLSLSMSLIESVLLSIKLIASSTKMFWSCFRAFYITLLFLSFLSFLFLHVLIPIIPVYPVAYMLSFPVSFLWSLSFLSYNLWCSSYSRPSVLVSWLWTRKCYQDEVLWVMLGCESNCWQTDLSLLLPFLLLFPITFYLCSCPYLPLALCFLHQLYYCCFFGISWTALVV